MTNMARQSVAEWALTASNIRKWFRENRTEIIILH